MWYGQSLGCAVAGWSMSGNACHQFIRFLLRLYCILYTPDTSMYSTCTLPVTDEEGSRKRPETTIIFGLIINLALDSFRRGLSTKVADNLSYKVGAHFWFRIFKILFQPFRGQWRCLFCYYYSTALWKISGPGADKKVGQCRLFIIGCCLGWKPNKQCLRLCV